MLDLSSRFVDTHRSGPSFGRRDHVQQRDICPFEGPTFNPLALSDRHRCGFHAEAGKCTQTLSGSWDGLSNGAISFDVIAAAGSDQWDEIVPKLRATLALDRRIGAEITRQTLVFDMVHPEAHASERTIGAQDPLLKDYLISRHRLAIPPSFYDTASPSGAMWKAATDLFASGGPLELALIEYFKNAYAPAATRMPLVDNITTIVRTAIGSWQSADPPLAAFLNSRLVQGPGRRMLTITDFGGLNPAMKALSADGGMQLPIALWLPTVAAFEKNAVKLDSSPNAAPAPGAVTSLMVVPDELLWLTNQHTVGVFRYTFKFSHASASDIAAIKKYMDKLPEWLRKQVEKYTDVPDASKAVKGVRAAIGIFKITISAEESTQLKAGAMDDSRFHKLWDERTLFGAMLELGVGTFSGLPDTMKIDSPFKVNPSAFADALFEISGGGASAGVKVPGMKGVDVGVSVRHMAFTLTDGTYLEGDLPEGKFVPDPVIDLSSIDLGQLNKMRKARSKKDLAGDLFDAKIGAGYVAGKLVVGQPKPEDWVKPKPKTVDGGARRTLTTFFKVDSAEINTDLNGWSRRFLLESILAVDLFLFNGTPGFSVVGHASPEGTPRHNLILSRLRAEAVKQAILDAVVVDSSFIIAFGNGDELAKRTPVDPTLGPLSSKEEAKKKGVQTFDEPDPDGNTTKRDVFAKAHTEQSSRWKEFRKVTIEWWGQFFAEIQTTGNESDDDAGKNAPQDAPPQNAPAPQQEDPNPAAVA